MAPPDDEERREQFVALFVRHEAAVHSFVLSLLPDLNEAEEVMQQASITMWKRFDQFTPGTNFRNWAFQVAKFTAMNHQTKLRRDRHRFQEDLMEMLADRATERNEHLELQRKALAHCLEKLPEEDRKLVGGCYREGFKMSELAEEVGRSANALYKQLNRIRSALLKCVEARLAWEGTQ